MSEAVKEASGAEPEIAGRSATLPDDRSPTVGEFLGRVTGSGKGTRGISVEVGEREAAIDITVTVPYGRPIQDLTGSMRNTIIQRVENMTGLRVTGEISCLKTVLPHSSKHCGKKCFYMSSVS